MLCAAGFAHAEEQLPGTAPQQAITSASQQQPAAVAQQEPASSKPAPDIDALAELGKLSEGDILLIEHSLAALYYYPNELTGKPSQKLVDATKEYQRKNLATAITGMLSKLDRDDLITKWMNFSGGLLLPLRYQFSKTEADIKATGSWLPENKAANPVPQNSVTILCVKEAMVCYEAFALFGAGSQAYPGHGVVSSEIILYQIKTFDQKKVVADVEVSENFSYQNMQHPSCYGNTLIIDLEADTIKKTTKLRADIPECHEKNYSAQQGRSDLLQDGRQEAIRRRFFELHLMAQDTGSLQNSLLQKTLAEAEKQYRASRKF